MRRTIRLKEWGVGVDAQRTPDRGSIERSDASLGEQSVRLRTDGDGFIASGLDDSDARGDIVVLGDSVVECMYLHEGQRLTDRCQAALRERGRRLRVRNGGMSGATSLHALMAILAKVVPLRPRAVVVLNGVIDIDAGLKPRGFWSRDAYLDPLKWETDPAPPPPAEASVPLDLSQRAPLLELIGAACDRFGLALAFATFPHRGLDAYALERGAWFEGLRELRRAVNADTRAHCAAAGRPCIDLEARFEGRADLFYDQFHLNHAGAAIVGAALADGLADWLPAEEEADAATAGPAAASG